MADLPDPVRDLLTQVDIYLYTQHKVVGRHDQSGPDLTCAGCALLGQVLATLGGQPPPEPRLVRRRRIIGRRRG
ncbi:MAG TPA: hypothetical protein VFX70_17460 [Mycobacteriales bacterium]|nr:hypothetical protein [Mycobacteriales bacterium]